MMIAKFGIRHPLGHTPAYIRKHVCASMVRAIRNIIAVLQLLAVLGRAQLFVVNIFFLFRPALASDAIAELGLVSS